MDVVVVDALAHGRYARRQVTVDVIGAGPRTVAGVLEQKGLNVDLYIAEDVVENPSRLRGYSALLVSGMSVDEPTVARIVRLWRRNSRGPVIVGGPIAADPEFLVRVRGDVGVYGEAEPVIEKLVETGIFEQQRLDPRTLERLCGIVYVENGGRLRVNRRCPIMPRRVWERYRPSTRVIRGYPLYWAARVYVEVVRGCSNYSFPRLDGILPPELLPEKPIPGCAYCSVIPLYGYARSRSIDHVYEEVKELIDQGVHRIVLSGPDFLDYGRDWLVEPSPLLDPRNPPPNTKAIAELLRRITAIPEVSSGEVSVMVENIKPNLVNDEVVLVLGRYLRGTPVHIGAETGDNKLLEALGRSATVYEVVKAVRLLRRHGLRPYVYIMYCLPGETSRTIRQTVEYMEKLYNAGAEKITVYKFTPLPLSYLHKLAGTNYDTKCPNPHPVRLRAEEINKRAKRRLIGLRIRVIIVGYYRGRRPLGYPLKHGPVVLLDRGSIGDLVDARIVDVISDRMVEATVIKRIKTLAGESMERS
ncbi:B12-binding domain-containing radical SAM protein [Hyperthermus butylicus]|uniref:Fe-S oxidoreductase, Radical SAM superfamily n=1 Tax=Hyperthermus butylicus (strain DSM 5456 / JCM 9403 / PLM1-5) TaxID=415426 RepID=A2BIW4_HYPBU|nr:radical SAM protein [Hyperthermus butylicus]ABM79925.1 Fe-S oxidoreductase, Radical SAM superfamily [Hyperthermus butylicus DSM 5456]